MLICTIEILNIIIIIIIIIIIKIIAIQFMSLAINIFWALLTAHFNPPNSLNELDPKNLCPACCMIHIKVLADVSV